MSGITFQNVSGNLTVESISVTILSDGQATGAFLDVPKPSGYTSAQIYQSRLDYVYESVGFIGRKKELADLQAFADNESRFSWLLITGGAGAGKSRLARHFCRQLSDSDWLAGFAKGNISSFFSLFSGSAPVIQSDKPVFLVVDYCEQHATALAPLLGSLFRAQNGGKVRVLLLERDHEQGWYQKLLQDTSHKREIAGSQYAKPKTLMELSDQEMVELTQAYVAAVVRHGKTTAAPFQDTDFLEVLRCSDEKKRPLSAMLIADGPAHGQPLETTGPQRLTDFLEKYMNRQTTNFWHGVDDRHLNLLCLATLCRGLPTETLAEPWPDCSRILPFGEDFQPGQYARLVNSPVEDVLSPLAPDLVGEYFVLRRIFLKTTSAFNFRNRVAARAVEKDPLGVFTFFNLCSRDFAAAAGFSLEGRQFHPAKELLRLDAATPTPDYAVARFVRASETVNMIAHYGTAGDIASARSLMEAMRLLADTHVDEPPLRECWATGAVNIIEDYRIAGDIASGRSLMDEVQSLADVHADEPPLREEWAKGAVKMITPYGLAGDFVSALGLLNSMQSLADTHADEPLLREWWAKGAFNMVDNYRTAGKFALARNLLDAMQSFADTHADEPPLREWWAKGASNTIAGYCLAGEFALARSLLNAMQSLADTHAAEPLLRELWAIGAFNMIIFYIRARKNESAMGIFFTLAAEAGTRADEPFWRDLMTKLGQ